MRRYQILPVFLVLLMAAVAIGGEGVRVEVIAPSTPVLDDFSLTYILARRGAAIDTAYRGEVWMWTDGPWIRPYHIQFTPADRGMIAMRMKFSGPQLQRVESYELGMSTSIGIWGNPILPVAEGAPQLLWGALDICDQPGLDFCLSQTGKSPALPGTTAIGFKLGWKDVRGQRLGSIWSAGAEGPTGALQFVPVDRKSAAGVAGKAGANIMLPTDGGLVGVWVDEPTAEGILAGLAHGRSYAAWGGRILIAPERQGRVLIAGHGPRLQASFSGASNSFFATDNYHLTATPPPGTFVLTVSSGSAMAVALDRVARP